MGPDGSVWDQTRVTIRCILDKVGGARTLLGSWCVLGQMHTLNCDGTWTATDDVSPVHKHTSTEKKAC